MMMSHNILGHADPHAATRGKAAEAEADVMAVELLARAGYDLTTPARFLRRSAGLHWLDLRLGHPGNGQRIRIVSASIARLKLTPRVATAP